VPENHLNEPPETIDVFFTFFNGFRNVQIMIQQDKGHAFVLFVVAAGHAGQIKGLVRWDHVAKPQQGDTGLRGVVGHFPFRESVAHDHVMDGHQRLWCVWCVWCVWGGGQCGGRVVDESKWVFKERERERHWCEYEFQSGPVCFGCC
jgi:hypothetical protein